MDFLLVGGSVVIHFLLALLSLEFLGLPPLFLLDKFRQFLRVHLKENIRHLRLQHFTMPLIVPRLEHNLRQAINGPDFDFGFRIIDEPNNLLKQLFNWVFDILDFIVLIDAKNDVECLVLKECVGVFADILQQLADPDSLFGFFLHNRILTISYFMTLATIWRIEIFWSPSFSITTDIR